MHGLKIKLKFIPKKRRRFVGVSSMCRRKKKEKEYLFNVPLQYFHLCKSDELIEPTPFKNLILFFIRFVNILLTGKHLDIERLD